MAKQKKHITVDDISDMQSLQESMRRAKADIKLRYAYTLEVENNNVNRAIKRLTMATACAVLSTAFEYATKVQEEEGRGCSIEELALQVVSTIPFLSMIAYGIGETVFTTKLDVLEKEDG